MTESGSTPAIAAASATIIAVVVSARVPAGAFEAGGSDGTPVDDGVAVGPAADAADGPALLAQPASVMTARTALAIGRDGRPRRGRLDAGHGDIRRMLRRVGEMRRGGGAPTVASG